MLCDCDIDRLSKFFNFSQLSLPINLRSPKSPSFSIDLGSMLSNRGCRGAATKSLRVRAQRKKSVDMHFLQHALGTCTIWQSESRYYPKYGSWIGGFCPEYGS